MGSAWSLYNRVKAPRDRIAWHDLAPFADTFSIITKLGVDGRDSYL
jgi:hypothetical protein